jgi:hypothetical protein
MRHIANHAAFRVDEPGQDHRDGDQFADLALTAFSKGRNDVQQRVFQRFLGSFRQREMLFFQRLAA